MRRAKKEVAVTTIRVDKEEFEKFKINVRDNFSDVSKEIRKMIAEYNRRYEARRSIDGVSA